MRVLRTSDDRFDDLPDFAFRPNYTDIASGGGERLRMHYLDEGPSGGPVVALMHGEPSWSFLYRKMIPVLVDAGLRCIAPDLIGFGRSDKPSEPDDYSFERHVDWTRALLFDHLDLVDVTLVGQDWGGLIGLRLVAGNPARFARVVVANTGLPDGLAPLSDALVEWRRFSTESPVFPIGAIISAACVTDLPEAVVAAYDAPFPDDEYKAGARIFPGLIPTSPDDPGAAENQRAWEIFGRLDVPFLTAFSDSDPITAGAERRFQGLRGAQGQSHTTIEGAGHFLQEDRGPELARVVVDFVAATS